MSRVKVMMEAAIIFDWINVPILVFFNLNP